MSRAFVGSHRHARHELTTRRSALSSSRTHLATASAARLTVRQSHVRFARSRSDTDLPLPLSGSGRNTGLDSAPAILSTARRTEPVASSVGVTGAVSAPTHFGNLPEVCHAGLGVRIDWRITDGSAGAVKVVASSPLVGSTTGQTITGPSSGTLIFRWLHGVTLGAPPFGFAIDARRVSGAGTVEIFTPLAGGGGGLPAVTP